MKTLCVEVGNTRTNIGLFEGDKILKNIQINTKGKYFSNDFNKALETLCGNKNIIDCAVSSVVDSVNKTIENIVQKFVKGKIIFLSSKFLPDKMFLVSKKGKEETGADILCDIIYANSIKNGPKIIIDLGTASKVIFIDKKNRFLTVYIFLGLGSFLSLLSSSTEKLPNIRLKISKIKPIPKETKETLNSSTYYCILGAIKYYIEHFKKHVNKKFDIFFCGGHSEFFKKEFSNSFYDKNFTLKGCYEFYKIIKGC